MQISRSGLCSSDPRLTSAFCRAAWWTDDRFPHLKIQMYQLLSLNSKFLLRSPPAPAPPRLQGPKQPGRVRHSKVQKFWNSIEIRDTFWEKKVLDQWKIKKCFYCSDLCQMRKGLVNTLLAPERIFEAIFNVQSRNSTEFFFPATLQYLKCVQTKRNPFLRPCRPIDIFFAQ